MNFQTYKLYNLLYKKLDNLSKCRILYNPPATRSLLVWEGRCDRLDRAGKARASVRWPSVGIAFPAASRPSHRPGDPYQKETEAAARDFPG
jgi:hypothetical protein